jgi:hypothetical protein
MEFTKLLIVQQKLEENSLVWELNCIALFGPLKQILLDIDKFCRFAHLWNMSWGTNSLLGARSNSNLINSQNFLTE